MKNVGILGLAMVMACALFAVAQEHAAAPSSAAVGEKSASEKKGSTKNESLEQQLAHESNEAAEGDENAQFKHSPTVRWVASKLGISVAAEYWVLYTLDFLIIALAIGWFWKKNIPGAFKARTATIRKTMEEAQAASADANRRLGEIEGRLSRLDQEIAQMRASADSEAAAEEQRIKTAAEEDSRKIVEAAQAEIESAARVAQRELKAYAAELAVSLAEKKMQVDEVTDRRLVHRFSRELATSEQKEPR